MTLKGSIYLAQLDLDETIRLKMHKDSIQHRSNVVIALREKYERSLK